MPDLPQLPVHPQRIRFASAEFRTRGPHPVGVIRSTSILKDIMIFYYLYFTIFTVENKIIRKQFPVTK
jgi:hypothetical protein